MPYHLAKRVGFYPSCTGNEPHFGHIYCGFANWLLAQHLNAEFLLLAAKGFSMPFHSPQNWLEKFALLDLPGTRMEVGSYTQATEAEYWAIEQVLERPGVSGFNELNPVHPGLGYFTLQVKEIQVHVLMTLNYVEGMKIRDFPILAMSDIAILSRIYGITDMIDGMDTAEVISPGGNPQVALLKMLFPDICGPEINQRYIPVIVDHNDVKISRSKENDAEYRIRPLLERYGRDNLLAIAFSALQPWKWTWWPEEVNLDWMIKHFDIEQFPDPKTSIQTYDREPSRYGKQAGLFQKVIFM